MDPDLMLSDAALDAAVGALAGRNAHHFDAMDASERAEAIATWKALSLDVLVAARATVVSEIPGQEPRAAERPGGRAVVVFEDVGTEDVAVHAAFHPQLQELENDQVAGTPAQITAMSLLQRLAEEGGHPQEG